MNVIVLGGAGLQGRAAMQDLCKSSSVNKIICVDIEFSEVDAFHQYLQMEKVEKRKVDATSKQELVSLFRESIDIVIDLLPKQFNSLTVLAAIEANVPIVNCSYASELSVEAFEMAKKNGVAIMPEAGLDPGIDLVLCGYGVSQLDEVYELYSYCGGIPHRDAADNVLKYKISWNFDSTIMSYKRPAVIKKDGETIHIPAEDQHNEEWITNIKACNLDSLESMPNGDAINFAEILGIADQVQSTERRTIRWAGHASFWSKMASLGFLETDPVKGIDGVVTPHEFLVKHLEPRLKYKENEQDLVVMKNILRGKKAGKDIEIMYELIDERDVESGLFAMNRTVGYTASIVAQMIVNHTINKKGLLSPTRDIPYQPFIQELEKRGIKITETINQLNKSLA